MVFNHQIITRSPQETAALGEKLAAYLVSVRAGEGELPLSKIVCLYGELGSGKTTFAQGFAKGLGIKSRLLSPTFIIVRHYQRSNNDCQLYHLDLYRITKANDLINVGFGEIILNPSSYILIEWAEKLKDNLPKKRIDVHFTPRKSNSRQIYIRKV